MGTPLRVLIVEDSHDDTALLLHELRRGGFEPVFERVDTASDMLSYLQKQEWDIVIADYVMPRFSGLAALAILKESGLDLPFIIVSGRIGEDVAVEAMKAGAHDYIVKGSLARLVPAIERELGEAVVRRERRRAEEALRKSYEELEMRVQERTVELARANRELHAEVVERRRAQEEREVLLVQVQEDRQRIMEMAQEAERRADQLREVNERLVIASIRQKELTRQAEREASKMKSLLESLNEGVTVIDNSGQIILRNQKARDILDMSDEEVAVAIATGMAIMLRPDGTPLPFEEWPARRALRGQHLRDSELIHVRLDGARRNLLFSTGGVLDETGEVAVAVLVMRDVTEVRELERMKEEYVSIISHDLRNPLTVIQGQASILQKSWDTDNAKRYGRKSLEFILGSVQRINAMVDDLIDSSRLEAGQLELERQPVELSTALKGLLECQLAVPGWKRVRLKISPDLLPVYADPARLERIVINLIGNAIKYSAPATRVLVRADRRDAETIISVSDHGMGIDPADLPNVFERFYRGKGGRKPSGVGLGLYITRMLVEAHGGHIWAESEPGKGSTFYFTLPLA